MGTYRVFHIFLFQVVLLMKAGLTIKITIDPAKYAGVEVNVHAICELDDKENDIKSIKSMSVARKGNDTVAAIFANQTVAYIGGNKDEYEAVGNILKGSEASKSEFNLAIKAPDTEDAGKYTCLVYYENKKGNLTEHTASASLSVEDPQVKDLKGNLKDLLDKVDKEGAELKEISKKADEKAAKKIKELEDKAEKQKKELKDIEEQDKKVDKKIEDLEKKAQEKLKKIEAVSQKEDADVTDMKNKLKDLVDKVKERGEHINEISTKETEDSTIVKDIEEKTTVGDDVLLKVEQKEKDLEKKIKEFVIKTKNQLKKFSSLDSKETLDKSRLADLEGVANRNEVGLQELAKNSNADELKVVSLEQQLKDLLKRVKDIKTQGGVSNSRPVNKPTRKGGSPIIAFAVTIQDTFLRPTLDEVLIFPDVITQVGEGYNINTGIFTAPVTGLYSFHTTIHTNCISCAVRVVTMKNNEPMVKLKLGVHYDRMQGSSSAVIQLTKGDTVRLHVDYASSGVTISNDRRSFFAGYLINVS